MNCFAVLVIYIILEIVITILCIVEFCSNTPKDKIGEVFPFINPWGLRKSTKMNWFGCITTCVICLPIFAFSVLFAFIYWIFHVGRKEYYPNCDTKSKGNGL